MLDTLVRRGWSGLCHLSRCCVALLPLTDITPGSFVVSRSKPACAMASSAAIAVLSVCCLEIARASVIVELEDSVNWGVV